MCPFRYTPAFGPLTSVLHSATTMDVESKQKEDGALAQDSSFGETLEGTASHERLDRNFSLLSISAVGIVTGNTWAALGGSIVSLALERIQAIC